MNNDLVDSQYATGLSRPNIERALVAGGKDLDHLAPADLAPLEDFHTMGRFATTELVELLEITSADEVLDAGSGIGGTARFVADRSGCRVTAVDLTEEYCDVNRWLNGLVGLGDQISVRQADVTQLPFPDGTFDAIFSQHVQMNVADKSGLYVEARRVLCDGGRIAIWDITSGENGADGKLEYPLPWADLPEYSHLVTPDELHRVIEGSGFAIEHWNDRTAQAGALMQTFLTLPPNPLGLHAFVTDFAVKATNLTAALTDGRLRLIQGIARAVT